MNNLCRYLHSITSLWFSKEPGGGGQPATLTIKTVGTPKNTTAAMNYMGVDGTWRLLQIDYTNDVMVNTVINGIVTVSLLPFTPANQDVIGCTLYTSATFNLPPVWIFYITDANATVTISDYD